MCTALSSSDLRPQSLHVPTLHSTATLYTHHWHRSSTVPTTGDPSVGWGDLGRYGGTPPRLSNLEVFSACCGLTCTPALRATALALAQRFALQPSRGSCVRPSHGFYTHTQHAVVSTARLPTRLVAQIWLGTILSAS